MEYKQTWYGPQGFRVTLENKFKFSKEDIKHLFEQIILAIDKNDFLITEKDNG